MGERGPTPKRQAEKLGKHKVIIQAASGTRERIPAPPPLEAWHPIAREWYLSLEHSGQSQFYEPSDWMLAITIAEQLSRCLSERTVVLKDGSVEHITQPMNGPELAGILRAMAMLMVDEASRRRASVELMRPTQEQDAQETKHTFQLIEGAFNG